MRTATPELTPRQREVLQLFLDRRDAQQPEPHIRDIMEAFDFESNNAAAGHLKALVRKGYLLHRAGCPAYVLNVERCPSRLEQELRYARSLVARMLVEVLGPIELVKEAEAFIEGKGGGTA